MHSVKVQALILLMKQFEARFAGRFVMSDGEVIDGVPLQDSSNDSSDSSHDGDRSTKSGYPAKIVSQSDIKVLQDTKPKPEASGFSMKLSRMTPSGSIHAQSLALSIKKSVHPKSASEIGAIKMKIGVQKCKEPPVIGIKRSSELVAKVFNPDESDGDEEMPPEAKMRMRNLGKDTPTAEGPNSFSKGKLGFCDRTKAIQRQLDQFVADPPVKKL